MRVLVIGSGCSGLVAMKCCLDEGLDVVCYEKDYDLGGLWRFEPGEKIGATVYRSTYINTSKTAMSFSDFPMPKEAPNFMHNSKVLEYYRSYADRFKLTPRLKFNTEVISCRFADDFETTGRWKVKSRCIAEGSDNAVKEEIFDAVLVAVGHHSQPYLPLKDFPGIDKFSGKVLHSHEYRDYKGFEGKRVVIIGLGNSGSDISIELSWHAKKVFASTRKGTWVFGRVGPNGVPLDNWIFTRYQTFLTSILPAKYREQQFSNYLNAKFDHAKYGLQPNFGPFRQHPTLSDDLPGRILGGAITVKPNVTHFTENWAHFEDGTSEEVDAVVFSTGYDFNFPFLEDSLLQRKGNDCALYKYVWPMGLPHSTMAVIGHVQALVSINPLAEMQSRWATLVFTGKLKLPSQSTMQKDIDEKKRWIANRFYKSHRHHMEVDHIDYIDELADIIGCKPNLLKLVFTDPELAYKVFFEMCSSYQYRLQGPGACYSEARERIMKQMESALYPLRTRVSTAEKTSSNMMIYALIVAIFALCFYCMH